MSKQSSFKVNYISIADNPDKLKLLVREYDSVDKTQQYNKCPVFKHRKNRTFVGYSPIDYKLGFDNGVMWSTHPELIGQFNISNWSRNTSLATRLVDKTKPLIIKKGDPLFRVTFLSPDLNSGVILKERSELAKLEFHLSKPKSKNYEEGNKLFSRTPNKCPFPFLKFLSK